MSISKSQQSCSWCDCNVSSISSSNIKSSANNPSLTNSNKRPINAVLDDKLFCSEKCFELSRRANFKRGRNCDWCDRNNNNTNNNNNNNNNNNSENIQNKIDQNNKSFELEKKSSNFKKAIIKTESMSKSDSSNTSQNTVSTSTSISTSTPTQTPTAPTNSQMEHLQFCTESCMNRYKQNLFEKETSVVLQDNSNQYNLRKKSYSMHTVSTKSTNNDNNNNINNNNNDEIIDIVDDTDLSSNYHYKVQDSLKQKPQSSINNYYTRCNPGLHIQHSNNRSSPRKSKPSTTLKKLTKSHPKRINNIQQGRNPFLPMNYSHIIEDLSPNSNSASMKSNFENMKFPLSSPIYIPVPIPIPIPIFKNAPEILNILHKYNYRPTKLPENITPPAKSNVNMYHLPSHHNVQQKSQEPQTEALDLSNNPGIIIDQTNFKKSSNLLNSNPISLTSILNLNDPYLKRRNRILDAPAIQIPQSIGISSATPSSSSSKSTQNISINTKDHAITMNNGLMKTYCNNYTDLISTHLKNNKHLKRRFDRNNNNNTNTTTTTNNNNNNSHSNSATPLNINNQLKPFPYYSSNSHNKYLSESPSSSTFSYTNSNKPITQNSSYHIRLSPKHYPINVNMQSAKSVLKRYPLLSLRRNIKSAPSSVLQKPLTPPINMSDSDNNNNNNKNNNSIKSITN